MQTANASVVQGIFDRFNQRDLDGLAEVVADDFELVDVPAGLTLRGQNALRQWFEGFLLAGPDARADLTGLTTEGEWSAGEHVGTFTHTGPLLTPSGPIPPTGKRVELPMVEVYRVRNGKLVVLRAYYDAATMLRQMGLLGE